MKPPRSASSTFEKQPPRLKRLLHLHQEHEHSSGRDQLKVQNEISKEAPDSKMGAEKA